MKYYAMKTEEGATLYFDNGGNIVDIDIPDGVETITFSTENGFCHAHVSLTSAV